LSTANPAAVGGIEQFCFDVRQGLECYLGKSATHADLAGILASKDSVSTCLCLTGHGHWLKLAAAIDEFPVDHFERLIAQLKCDLQKEQLQ